MHCKHLHIKGCVKLFRTLYDVLITVALCLQRSCCYVLEYMEGGDLHSLFSRIGVFSEARTRFYAAEITLAVDFLHTCGIVHR